MDIKMTTGLVAGTIVGVAGAFMLMQKMQPGSTEQMMNKGRRMMRRYSRQVGLDV